MNISIEKNYNFLTQFVKSTSFTESIRTRNNVLVTSSVEHSARFQKYGQQ